MWSLSAESVEWMAFMGSNEHEAKFGLGMGETEAFGGDTFESTVEVAGASKWFDIAKGYGFIIPDNGTADVLLHVSVLRRDGFQSALEGARIVVEAVQRPKGLQAPGRLANLLGEQGLFVLTRGG